jgi:hypothetical protein
MRGDAAAKAAIKDGVMQSFQLVRFPRTDAQQLRADRDRVVSLRWNTASLHHDRKHKYVITPRRVRS